MDQERVANLAGRPEGRHRLFVINECFVCFGYTDALAGGRHQQGEPDGGDPGPVLLLAALVLAAELMPLELGRPGTRDSTTMSQPFAVALGAAGALYELAGGDPGRAQVSPPAFVAAALAVLVVNNLLLEAVLVLAGGTPALDRVRQGVGLRAWVAAMLLGMAPVVMVWPRPASA